MSEGVTQRGSVADGWKSLSKQRGWCIGKSVHREG
jgi:hypothetical protein